MDFLNFDIDGQYIGLQTSDSHLDLHNNFRFSQLHYSPVEATLSLVWYKSDGEWARKEPYTSLTLIFTGVGYFRVRERDPAYPLREDETLEHICRTPLEAREEFENIYFNADTQPEYDLLLRFESEWAIKVNAASVRLHLESK